MVSKKGEEDNLSEFFNTDDAISDLRKYLKELPALNKQSVESTFHIPEDVENRPVYENESELKKNYLEKLLIIMDNEEDDKRKNRKSITKYLLWYFSIITIFAMVVVACSNLLPTNVVLAVVGGFFANVISLLLLLLKYIYSPSKELHNFIVQLFKDKHENKKDDDCN